MDISNVFGKVNNANSLSTNNTSNKQDVNKADKSELGELLQKSNGKQVEVKGEIINVTNKQVSIKVGDQIIQGNMNLEGKLNIGDLRNFLLEVESGKIKLMLLPENSEVLKDQHLENVLKDLGELSKENLKFAKALLDSNLPVNKDTLTALKRSMALFGKSDEHSLDKSMLMLKNDMPVNMKNTESVNNLLDRQQNITKNLETIDNLLSQLSDEPITQELKQILSDLGKNTETTTNNLIKGETKNLENLSDVAKLVAENVLDDDNQSVTQNKNIASDNANIDDNIDTLKNLLKSVASADSNENTKTIQSPNNQNTDPNISTEDSENIKNLLNKLQNNENTENQNILDKTKQNIPSENNKDVANTLLKHLGKNQEEVHLEKEVLKNFGVDENIATPKDLEKHINDKLDKLDKALELLKNIPNSPKDVEVLKHLEKEITTIKDKLTFASEIKDNVFVQIPFTLNNKSTNGELVVFKDKRNKRQNKDYSSALVSLDTANLGLFEAYVVKKQSKVDIQFRFVNDFVKDLVQSNAPKLDTLLKEKQININSLSYKKIDEPFSIIQEEPQIKKIDISNNSNPFKFDVRG